MMRAEKSELAAVVVALALIAFCALTACLHRYRIDRESISLASRPLEASTMLPIDRESISLASRPLEASIMLPCDNSRLLPGYNYFLLKRLAGRMGTTASIDISGNRDAALDSLSADIVVLPLSDSSLVNDDFVSLTVDSACLWVIRNSKRHLVREAKGFIGDFMQSEDYRQAHYIYMMTYDPFRGASRSTLSPYDAIIRAQADSLKCDWRLLAAIIWQESHFHIEAASGRGARGLMQLVPETGRKHGAEDLTDPEQNIRAGVRYLKNLKRQFSGIPASPEEQTKIMLAAYNAGAGRIHDCIATARQRDIDPGYWENLESVIPSMRDSSILDTVELRCGIFQGHETIAYVDRVLAIYREFCRMCPDKQ